MYTMFFWTALRLYSKHTRTIILTSSTISTIQVTHLFRVEMKRVHYLINRLGPVFLSGFSLAPNQQKKIWATKCNYWICKIQRVMKIELKQHSDNSLSVTLRCSYQTQANNLSSIGIWSQNGSQYHRLQILRHNHFIWELSGVYNGYLFTAMFLQRDTVTKAKYLFWKWKCFKQSRCPRVHELDLITHN